MDATILTVIGTGIVLFAALWKPMDATILTVIGTGIALFVALWKVQGRRFDKIDKWFDKIEASNREWTEQFNRRCTERSEAFIRRCTERSEAYCHLLDASPRTARPGEPADRQESAGAQAPAAGPAAAE